jgi:hypothetical protein
MSTALERIKASSAWMPEFDLPLFPGHNNPWIYGALALKCLRASGLNIAEDIALVNRFEEHAAKCNVSGIRGLFHRWPNGSGGVTSHDELMGMAYISPRLASDILDRLEERDGVYDNTNPASSDSERYNLYRFPFFKPYMQASTYKRRVGLATQAQWAAFMIGDAWHYERGDTKDAGGRIRNWLMLEAMNEHVISYAASLIWSRTMKAKDCSPRTMLSFEPGDLHPILSHLAPLEF